MSHVTARNTGSGGRIRTERVRGSIRQEIAEMLLRQEIRDPRLAGFISITDVRLTPDLQYATVYFSVVDGELSALSFAKGGEGEEAVGSVAASVEAAGTRAKACQEALTHAAGFIRSQLGRRISFRHTPHLRFLPDNSMDYGMRMDRLLDSLHIPPPEAEESGPAPSIEKRSDR